MSIQGLTTFVLDYSHSTVFTTEVPSVVLNNAPPLTTIYTPPSECEDRWMLASSNYLGDTITLNEPVNGDPDTLTTAIHLLVPGAFDLTVWSVDKNPSFSSCRPYSAQPLYSPGVCPDGHTVAEITEFHASHTSGDVLTSWVASCCRRYMSSTATLLTTADTSQWYDFWSRCCTLLHEQHLHTISSPRDGHLRFPCKIQRLSRYRH
jgi:hypothetical protein